MYYRTSRSSSPPKEQENVHQDEKRECSDMTDKHLKTLEKELCCISIERYLSICHTNNNYNHHKSYLLLIIPSLFAVLYNIPKFFELLACEENSNEAQYNINDFSPNISESIEINASQYVKGNLTVMTECTPEGLQATPMRQNKWYIIFYSVLSKLLLVEVIPWIAVIVLNYIIWKKIREFQAKREHLMKNSSNQGKRKRNTNYNTKRYMKKISASSIID